MMFNIEIIGFIAGGLVSLSFLPQVIKSWKTKQVKDLSMSLTIINILGQLMWIVYGLFKHSLSIIIMSCITLLFTSILLFLKIKLTNGLNEKAKV